MAVSTKPAPAASAKAAAQESVRQILTEDVLSLTEARAEFEQVFGRRVDKSTVARWMKHGAGGVKLSHVRLGNQLFTSRQRMTAFLEERTAKA